MAYSQGMTPLQKWGRPYKLLTWEQIEEDTVLGTTLKKLECPAKEKVFRAFGVWAGATITLKGSIKTNPDETVSGDWYILKDDTGTNIAVTSDGYKVCRDMCRWILPVHSGGGGTQDIDVHIMVWP